MMMFLFIVVCLVVFGFWNLVKGGAYLIGAVAVIAGLTLIISGGG